MIPCISVSNMRESDRKTIETLVPSRTLMYRAATGVFRAADWRGETVIAVGGGNNGGDGFALACILRGRGYACHVVKLSDHLSADSAYFAQKADELGVPIFPDCESKMIKNLGWAEMGETLPDEYKDYPYYNF